MTSTNQPTALFVTTSPRSATFLTPVYATLAHSGWKPVLVFGASDSAAARPALPYDMHEIPLQRGWSMSDVGAMRALSRVISEEEPDLIVFGTPKAAVVSGIVSKARRVPKRVFILHGLRSSELAGPSKFLVRAAEQLADRCASYTVVVSDSLRQQAIAEGIVRTRDSGIILSGSVGGVDIDRFQPIAPQSRLELRQAAALPLGPQIIGYFGRIAADKGIEDLYEAFVRLASLGSGEVRLLLAGDEDPTDPVPSGVLARIEADSRVIRLHRTTAVHRLMPLVDVGVSASRREGLGLSLLELGACGIPVAATKIPGHVDAVVDGQTGLLVQVGQPEQLASAMHRLLSDAVLRQTIGQSARARTVAEFDSNTVAAAFVAQVIAEHK